jgi:toxin ParE1/3/4
MGFEVVLTHDAERDLEQLYDYISEADSRKNADHVLERLLEVAETLSVHPERGSQPQELRALGMHEYRQVFFKPYRVIYRVTGKRVVVFLIADGRRDMQTLLSRRILGA